MDKKFELTNESIDFYGRTLYRIRALKDFGCIKAGQLGGFVETESNLSQEGNCWIYSNAKVYDSARVYDNAQICDYAIAHDSARIFQIAVIDNNVQVYGNAMVFGNVRVYNNVRIFDNAKVHDNALIRDNAKVFDNAEVYNNARVYDNAVICDNVKVFGSTEVFGNAKICGDAKIYDNAIIYDDAIIYGNAIIKETQVVHTGCCKVDLSKNLRENIRCQTNLFPQKDYVIAYKQVKKDLTSLYDNTFQYKIGEWVEVENPEMSNASCASGLHFSNMNYWDRVNINTTYLMAKIMLDDIITVQMGKIRCKRAFIIDKYEIED